MAFRMQDVAPEVTDISLEPESVRKMYGAEPGKRSFANNCLLARRLVERGVRFVELFHESWDQHFNLTGDLKKKIIGTKDLSYTGEFGLQELLDKSEDLLAAEEVLVAWADLLAPWEGSIFQGLVSSESLVVNLLLLPNKCCYLGKHIKCLLLFKTFRHKWERP
jgi:hypothetical protein